MSTDASTPQAPGTPSAGPAADIEPHRSYVVVGRLNNGDPDDDRYEWWAWDPVFKNAGNRRGLRRGDHIPVDHPLTRHPGNARSLVASSEPPNTDLRRDYTPEAREAAEEYKRARRPVMVTEQRHRCARCGWEGEPFTVPEKITYAEASTEGMEHNERPAHIRWVNRRMAEYATGKRAADAARVLASRHRCPADVHGEPIELDIDDKARKYYGIGEDTVAQVTPGGVRVDQVGRGFGAPAPAPDRPPKRGRKASAG